jgi:phenylalanyl-tRNA synthetase alpha chain
MNNITLKLSNLETELLRSIELAATEEQLEAIRVTFLGRNGHIANLMQELKDLSLEQKRIFGPQINQVKNVAQNAYDAKKNLLFKNSIRTQHEQYKDFDVTAYTPDQQYGSLHVLTKVITELEDIFISMGYDVVDGPELETNYYNFEALNIPADHPAREHHDTFWVNDNLLLRTHTSPVQVREIEKRDLPLAIFAPGRTYRNEATDASHDFMFTQGECLYIDKDVSIGNLLATAKHFLQAFFNKKDLNIRVRPGYFPFVEPGLEIDASCPFCTKGCSTCKHTGWIELLGSGLVHPNVLKCSGIDPEKYSGFAFGFGIERLALIKYGINDIRLFHSSKIEFLKQF